MEETDGLSRFEEMTEPQGVFSRQVFLGEGLDTDRLEAGYHDGVLTLRVPVLESARPRRVPIRMAEGGQQTIVGVAVQSTWIWVTGLVTAV